MTTPTPPPDIHAAALVEAAAARVDLEQLVERVRECASRGGDLSWLDSAIAERTTRGRAKHLLTTAIVELSLRGWPGGIEVYGVRYSNYEPPEIDAIYLTEQAAQAHADWLNNQLDHESPWDVCRWKVNPEFELDRVEKEG